MKYKLLIDRLEGEYWVARNFSEIDIPIDSIFKYVFIQEATKVELPDNDFTFKTKIVGQLKKIELKISKIIMYRTQLNSIGFGCGSGVIFDGEGELMLHQMLKNKKRSQNLIMVNSYET